MHGNPGHRCQRTPRRACPLRRDRTVFRVWCRSLPRKPEPSESHTATCPTVASPLESRVPVELSHWGPHAATLGTRWPVTSRTERKVRRRLPVIPAYPQCPTSPHSNRGASQGPGPHWCLLITCRCVHPTGCLSVCFNEYFKKAEFFHGSPSPPSVPRPLLLLPVNFQEFEPNLW